jgi:hypothetical protein
VNLAGRLTYAVVGQVVWLVNSAFPQALFGAGVRTPDQVFDGLADVLERHTEPGFLPDLLRKR